MKTMIGFRLDDICPTMHKKRFQAVMDILMEQGVPPLLGVIPDCRDPKLRLQPEDPGFDSMIHEYQQRGCEIALHGDTHMYDTKNGGILQVGTKSEFAGHTEEEQKRRLAHGLAILNARGFQPKIFMAPSHSYDQNTLRALQQLDIHMVTDGYTRTNYTEQGILFIPCRHTVALRRKMKGIVTVCLHTNTMDEEERQRLRAFLKKYSGRCVPYSTLINEPARNTMRRWKETFYRTRYRLETKVFSIWKGYSK